MPQACSPGSFGNVALATAPSDCLACPPNTFTNLINQTACRPCGSSATSNEGQATCTCLGKYRYFQVSDGSCDCLSGYVFYDTTDNRKIEGNSDLDCQPEVWKRFCAHMNRLVCGLGLQRVLCSTVVEHSTGDRKAGERLGFFVPRL